MSKSNSKSTPNPPSPPHYQTAASNTLPTTHHFHRASRFSSKIDIHCTTGIIRYTFAPDTDSNPRVWIYAGASTSNPALGYLTFPKSHNAFRLNFASHPDPDLSKEESIFAFTDVRARVGYPHPSTFAFKSSLSGREYVWTNRRPSEDVTPVQYDLSSIQDYSSQRIATLTVDKKSQGGTRIAWAVVVRSELEQAFLVLSAVGVITRLSRKARGDWKERWFSHDGGNGSGRQLGFAFWWYAVMMSAYM